MGVLSNKLYAEILRRVTAAQIATLNPIPVAIARSFTGGDPTMPVGEQLEFASRLLIVQNFTDQEMFFSIQLSGGWNADDADFNDRFVLPANGQLILDETTNRSLEASVLEFGIGVSFSCTSAVAPTTGSVYLSSFYALN
jgi:hypothetical protein